MIKCVIFDLGGVLLNLDFDLCFSNFEALGMDLKQFMKRGNDDDEHKGSTLADGITSSGMTDLYQVGKISTADFLEETKRLCSPGTSMEQVIDAWNSVLLDIPQYKLDLIKDLRRKGYKTFMLSNTNESHWQLIEKKNFPEPVSHYFDDLFLSQELHLAKPGDEIYLEVLRRIGFRADECIFVDDSQANCDAAAALGIKAIKYNIGDELKIDL